MITDDELERLIEQAAEVHEVPAFGAERVVAERQRLAAGRSGGRGIPRLQVRRSAERRWRLAGAGLALVAVVVGAGVGLGELSGRSSSPDGATSSEGAASGGAAAPAPATAPDPGSASTSESGGSSGATPGVTAPAPTTRTPTAPPAGDVDATRIIEEGRLSLTVGPAQVPTVLDRLTALAAETNGYVADSSASGSGSGVSGAITLRIPSASYPQVLEQARGLGRVTRSGTEAEDVTGRYVDLDARIRALVETRRTYLALLARAGSISETLAVQQQITEVQSEIEQLSAQQKLLAQRAALATLTVNVSESSAERSDDGDADGFGAAWSRAVDGFTGGLEALVAASGPVALVAIVAALLYWPGRWVFRRLRRRMV